MMIKNFNNPTSSKYRQLLVDVNDTCVVHEYSLVTNKFLWMQVPRSTSISIQLFIDVNEKRSTFGFTN